jgi:predicted HicB family RNase H-like nuclease
MQKRRGRPPVPPAKTKADYLEVRLEEAEKRAFAEAADLAGLSLSAWVRERLRTNARKELHQAGRAVAFLVQNRPAAGAP